MLVARLVADMIDGMQITMIINIIKIIIITVIILILCRQPSHTLPLDTEVLDSKFYTFNKIIKSTNYYCYHYYINEFMFPDLIFPV